MRQTIRIAFLATVSIFLFFSQGFAGSPKIWIRVIPGDAYGNTTETLCCEPRYPASSDNFNFYLVDKNDPSKKSLYLTLPDFDWGHYHSSEFHHGHLYAWVEKNPNSGKDYRYELWKFDEEKRGTLLLSGRKNSDFRASDDEKFIAVQRDESNSRGQWRQIDILDSRAKLLKSFGPQELGVKPPRGETADEGEYNLLQWSGHHLWFCDGEDSEDPVDHYFEVDADTGKTTTYPLVGGNFGNISFNPTRKLILYNNYPHFEETDSEIEFLKTKPAIYLKVYDMVRQESFLVDSGIGKMLGGHWIDGDTIEYDDPRGQGKIRKNIRQLGIPVGGATGMPVENKLP